MISAIIFLLQIQIYNKLNEIKLEFLAVGLRHLHNSQLSATFTPAVTSEFYWKQTVWRIQRIAALPHNSIYWKFQTLFITGCDAQ